MWYLLNKKKPFLALEKWFIYFYNKNFESHFGNLVWHGKPHVCAKYRHLIRKIWQGYSHELGHLAWKPWTFIDGSPFCEHFFEIFFVFLFYNFSWKLVHIKGLHAKGLHFLTLFLIFFHFLQNRVNIVGMAIHKKGLNLSTFCNQTIIHLWFNFELLLVNVKKFI